jgi:hypothetical protein
MKRRNFIVYATVPIVPQDNWQYSYDGSYVWKKHTFRYGAAFTHIRLGGFANFAGPLLVRLAGDAEPGRA